MKNDGVEKAPPCAREALDDARDNKDKTKSVEKCCFMCEFPVECGQSSRWCQLSPARWNTAARPGKLTAVAAPAKMQAAAMPAEISPVYKTMTLVCNVVFFENKFWGRAAERTERINKRQVIQFERNSVGRTCWFIRRATTHVCLRQKRRSVLNVDVGMLRASPMPNQHSK